MTMTGAKGGYDRTISPRDVVGNQNYDYGKTYTVLRKDLEDNVPFYGKWQERLQKRASVGALEEKE